MDTVLGIDIGTTSVKAAAFTPAGRATATRETALALLEPAPGQAVQDPERVVAAALAAARDALADARHAGLAVAGVALSGAMHGLVALDGRGRPLTPLLTWADGRAAAQAERVRREHPGLHARTGTPPHPMSPLTKMMWLAEHEPALARRAACWCGAKELVVARLCGDLVTDVSIASGTGLLALDTLDWDPEALALAGVAADTLPALAPTPQVLALSAQGARELGADPALPLVLGAADGPLANVGVGAVAPGVAGCSIGTSGALRVVAPRPAADPAGRLFSYALTPGHWVLGGAVNNGGVVLEWAGDALAPELDAEALLALAAQAPAGSAALLMLPALLGERAPQWSTLPRGAYVGLTRAHRREHLVRAALEGVCQQLALVAAALQDAGHALHEVRATGGFARSPFWRQLLCDVLGRPVGFPRDPQGSAFGAALLGMAALGIVDGVDRAGELVALGEVLEPDPAAQAVYAALRPAFAALADALGPAFAALRAQDRVQDGGPGAGSVGA